MDAEALPEGLGYKLLLTLLGRALGRCVAYELPSGGVSRYKGIPERAPPIIVEWPTKAETL